LNSINMSELHATVNSHIISWINYIWSES